MLSGRWNAATVVERRENGTYLVDWDDGRISERERTAEQILAEPPAFQKGDRVEGLYRNGVWYRATVADPLEGGLFLLNWDDGDSQDRVKTAAQLRRQ
mmetsp:Transcript_64472/g.172661  ORF Transcript_64472/g.172661 Transcript_64472/m.172661 type:complete len:98 (-) Transcript_64472:104-397(-)